MKKLKNKIKKDALTKSIRIDVKTYNRFKKACLGRFVKNVTEHLMEIYIECSGVDELIKKEINERKNLSPIYRYYAQVNNERLK